MSFVEPSGAEPSRPPARAGPARAPRAGGPALFRPRERPANVPPTLPARRPRAPAPALTCEPLRRPLVLRLLRVLVPSPAPGSLPPRPAPGLFRGPPGWVLGAPSRRRFPAARSSWEVSCRATLRALPEKGRARRGGARRLSLRPPAAHWPPGDFYSLSPAQEAPAASPGERATLLINGATPRRRSQASSMFEIGSQNKTRKERERSEPGQAVRFFCFFFLADTVAHRLKLHLQG